MNEDIKKLQASVDIIAQTTAHILSTMATKADLADVHITINAIQTDLRSFKQDTQHNFDKLEKRMDDSDQTLLSFDKRLEFLETKVLA